MAFWQCFSMRMGRVFIPRIGGAAPEIPGGQRKDGEGAKDGTGQTAMERKRINDAAAYIRSLANLRGRNADWGELAVRDAASLTANEALEKGVIDLVATDMNDLLQKLQGRSVTLLGSTRVLETASAHIETIQPDWRSRLLAVITDPKFPLNEKRFQGASILVLRR